MKINKKMFAGGLAIVLLCWIGNITYYFYNRLDNVVFMDNYKEIAIWVNKLSEDEYDGDLENISEEEKENFLTNVYVDGLMLPYIKDINNTERIVSVTFPELDNLIIYAESDVNAGVRYDNYKLETIGWNNMTLLQDQKQTLLKYIGKDPITNVVYNTDSGRNYKVDIGRVYLVEAIHDENNIVTSSSSGSDNLGKGFSKLILLDDIKITSIESKVLDEVREFYNIYVNNKHIDEIEFPLEVKKNNGFEVRYSPKEKRAASFVCRLKVNLENNNEKSSINMPIEFNNYFGLNLEIIKSIKKGGNISYEISNE